MSSQPEHPEPGNNGGQGTSLTPSGSLLSRLSLETRDKMLGYTLLTPTFFFFVVLIGYPFFQSIFLSFTETHTVSQRSSFVGFDNYLRIFADPEFWASLENNFIWTAGTMTLQVTVGVAVALLMHQSHIVLRSLARGLVLAPYLIPTVVTVLVWQWVFNDLYGIINAKLLDWELMDDPIDWLGSMPNAMISIILVGGWKYFPFVVIADLARLLTIPDPLYEAAEIDGAGAWSRFWDITLPQLRGVLVIVILLRSIWDFKEFDLIYLMTGGGPVIGTQTLPLLVYKEAFPLLHMGRAAALAMIMLAIMLVFMYFYFKTYGRDEGEDT